MVSIWETVAGEYEDYLRDESRSIGQAEFIDFPNDENELLESVKRAAREKISITVQGARTGISAGAVPHSGLILNLSRMNRVLGIRYAEEDQSYTLLVQPGVVLSQLREEIAKKSFSTEGWSDEDIITLERFKKDGQWFFPPDPTETSASIGGMIACNASGARSYHYGSIRDYVHGLTVITASGDKVILRRGENRAKEHQFAVEAESGKTYTGVTPQYPWPKIKNASGYFSGADLDLTDLFIGSEGTLGIVALAEIRLIHQPEAMWSMTAFFPGEDEAVRYVENLKKQDFPGAETAAIEYFNHRALALLRKQRHNPAFAEIPDMPPNYHTAIYTEIHGEDEDAVSDAMMTACEILVDAGGDDEHTWIATNAREMEKLHFFRHATPEAVNLLIDDRRKQEPELTKLGTDMAVSDEHLTAVLEMYNHTLTESGLEWVMFGHIGDNHIHVNILPENLDDYAQGKKLYTQWAKEVIFMGGTVSAEHGIGKLKVAMLSDMYGQEGMEMMRQLKKVFDPDGRLNPGSIFGN